VTLRAAKPDDLESIAEIERSAFTDPWSRASFRSMLDQAPVWFVVAETGERVVGYVVAWFIGGDGEIGNVAVDESQRGQGIGSMLLDAVLAEARKREVDSVYLEVRESNLPARRMYERYGFARVGRRRRYYRRPEEDALILRLALTPASAGEDAGR
jgi:ribosomal-protein-alanine N-acetyltransferase